MKYLAFQNPTLSNVENPNILDIKLIDAHRIVVIMTWCCDERRYNSQNRGIKHLPYHDICVG